MCVCSRDLRFCGVASGFCSLAISRGTLGARLNLERGLPHKSLTSSCDSGKIWPTLRQMKGRSTFCGQMFAETFALYVGLWVPKRCLNTDLKWPVFIGDMPQKMCFGIIERGVPQAHVRSRVSSATLCSVHVLRVFLCIVYIKKGI